MLQLLQGSELYLISRVENDEEQAVPPFLPLPRPRACARCTARPRSACDAIALAEGGASAARSWRGRADGD